MPCGRPRTCPRRAAAPAHMRRARPRPRARSPPCVRERPRPCLRARMPSRDPGFRVHVCACMCAPVGVCAPGSLLRARGPKMCRFAGKTSFSLKTSCPTCKGVESLRMAYRPLSGHASIFERSSCAPARPRVRTPSPMHARTRPREWGFRAHVRPPEERMAQRRPHH